LETARRAARSVLSGKGLLAFLALWIARGERPYPRSVKILLALGWLAVGGLIIYLLAGRDPDAALFPLVAMLTALWGGLLLIGFSVAAVQGGRAWRAGKEWSTRLAADERRIDP